MLIPEIQKVVCAAIRVPGEKDPREENKGKVPLIICGARHYDTVMIAQLDALGIDGHYGDQGFIDQWGNYLTRQEAYHIALQRGQYKPYPPYQPGTLYSEDLY